MKLVSKGQVAVIVQTWTGAPRVAGRHLYVRLGPGFPPVNGGGDMEGPVALRRIFIGTFAFSGVTDQQRPSGVWIQKEDGGEAVVIRVGRGDVSPVRAVVGGKEQPIAGGDPSGAGGEQFEVLDWQRNDWHFGELLRGELPGCGASRRGGLRVNDNPLCPSGEASRQGERGNREKIPGEIRGQLLSAEIIGCRIELVKLNSEYRGAYPTLRRQPGSGFSNPKAAKNSGPSFAWNYLPLAQNVHRFKRQRGLAMVKAGIKSSGNQKAPALCVPICQECPRSVPPTKGTPPPPYLL